MNSFRIGGEPCALMGIEILLCKHLSHGYLCNNDKLIKEEVDDLLAQSYTSRQSSEIVFQRQNSLYGYYKQPAKSVQNHVLPAPYMAADKRAPAEPGRSIGGGWNGWRVGNVTGWE